MPSFMASRPFDALLSFSVAALVVSYWRGGWYLWDFITCTSLDGIPFCPDKDEHKASGVLSEIVGGTMVVLALLLRKPFAHLATSSGSTLGFFFAMLHTLWLGTATVSLWRGCWYLSDAWILSGEQPSSETRDSSWLSCLVGFAVLWVLGAERSVLAPPSAFMADSVATHVGSGWWLGSAVVADFAQEAPLLLASQDNQGLACGIFGNRVFACTRTLLKPLDIFLSVGVVTHSVVWFWRGAWLLWDHYEWGFNPDPARLHRTAKISTLVGFGLYFFELLRGWAMCQFEFKELGSENEKPDRVRYISSSVLLQIDTLVLAIAAVSTWRGVWYFWDFYSGVTLTSALVSHFIGACGLVLLGAFRSIFAPPAVISVRSNTIAAEPNTIFGARKCQARELALQKAKESSISCYESDASEIDVSTPHKQATTMLSDSDAREADKKSPNASILSI